MTECQERYNLVAVMREERIMVNNINQEIIFGPGMPYRMSPKGIPRRNPSSSPMNPAQLIHRFLTNLCKWFISIVIAVLFFVPRTLHKIYSTKNKPFVKTCFTGCQGKLSFFRFCPPDSDGVIIYRSTVRKSGATLNGATPFFIFNPHGHCVCAGFFMPKNNGGVA